MIRHAIPVLFSVLLPITVVAHGVGTSFHTVVEPYLVDINSLSADIQPGEEIEFSFQLYRNDPTRFDVVPFTRVAYSITQDEEVLTEGEASKAEGGYTGMRYTFPADGIYELHTRFLNTDDEVVALSVPVPVGAGGLSKAAMTGIVILFVAVIVFCIRFRYRPFA